MKEILAVHCKTPNAACRFNLTELPANNLRRISTMYVRGYLQGSENGRVVTIGTNWH
jgi:hypothetical protein